MPQPNIRCLDHQQAFAHAAAGSDQSIAEATPKGDLKAAAYLQGVINGSAEQEAIARGIQGAEIAKSMYEIKSLASTFSLENPWIMQHIPGYNLSRDMVESAFLSANL